ncbi:MAG: hypothetical protein ACREOO_02110 [bacterium]
MIRSAWYKEQKQEKRRRDERRDYEHCYSKSLREDISPVIALVKERFEKETLYKIEIRPSFSSITVFIKHAGWKSKKLFDLHFKLKACPHGIFLMYGAHFKVQSNSFPPTPRTLYGEPKRIDKRILDSTIAAWIKDATNINIRSLQLTEQEAENEIKHLAEGAAVKHRWQILLCRLFRLILRVLGFL